MYKGRAKHPTLPVTFHSYSTNAYKKPNNCLLFHFFTIPGCHITQIYLNHYFIEIILFFVALTTSEMY